MCVFYKNPGRVHYAQKCSTNTKLPLCAQHLKRIRQQTGADVHVDTKAETADVRLVSCKSTEPADSQYCGAAEALMRCVTHAMNDKGPNLPPDAKPEERALAIATAAANAAMPKSVKLVAQGRQLGVVIGMKGATIK